MRTGERESALGGEQAGRAALRLGAAAAWAALALSAACGGSRDDTLAAVAAAADTADQLMIGLDQYITEGGVRKAFLQADSAFLYEVSGRADLRNIRVVFFAPNGDTSSVLTARAGQYDWRTGMMQARQDVVVVLSSGGRLTTSVLDYDQARNEVKTDQHYVYVSPDQNLGGQGFVTDPGLSMFRTQQLRGRAGAFTLPGQ